MDKSKLGKGISFERIRRITGYLVGTLEKWNDAKKAEEKDRVKHGIGERRSEQMDNMKILDTRHTCQNCRFNDGMVYTSSPVKYKCTFDGNFYEGLHPCHLDLAPVVRCKDCVNYKPYAKPVEDFDGFCEIREGETDDYEFCSYGKRRSE